MPHVIRDEDRHILTDEERRRGAARTNELASERKALAERIAAERYADLLTPALNRLEGLIDSAESEAVLLAAIRDVVEHVIGKVADKKEHSGDPDRPVKIVVESAFSRVPLDSSPE